MSATPDDCFHLSIEIVREVHKKAISTFGGSDGLRDSALLESAVAAPQATFGGRSPYNDLAEVAAAYLFYLCRNHPFLDGNKRVALGLCLVFLRLNGMEPAADGPEWEDLCLGVAASAIDREEATIRLRKLLKKKSRTAPPTNSRLASPRVPCDLQTMPHRPPRKTKKPANPADKANRAAQFEGQRRHEMATRSTLFRFQNRKSEKK